MSVYGLTRARVVENFINSPEFPRKFTNFNTRNNGDRINSTTANYTTSAPFPGGTNYIMYEPADAAPCPLGRAAITHYDLAQETIDGQLRAMYNNGQRRLRIPIFHRNIGGDCLDNSPGVYRDTIIASAGGRLAPQCRENLRRFLVSAREIGFQEVQISFHPQGDNGLITPSGFSNWPANWQLKQPYETRFLENKEVILSTRDTIRSAGIPYTIDLYNEAIPNFQPGNTGWRNQQLGWLQYSQRLWYDYVQTVGKADTVGFSFGAGYAVDNLAEVFQNNFPPILSPHFYGADTYSEYLTMWNKLNSRGQRQPWIIGEMIYNDAVQAAQIAGARLVAGNTLNWVAQWPRPSTFPQGCQITVFGPTDVTNMRKQGL